MVQQLIDFVKKTFNTEEFIPLHAPAFTGNEKAYLEECIDSTFVSSVGQYVNRFEEMTAAFAGTKYAVATVNGTAALHIALLLAGVSQDEEVITQPLTFVGTCNAIRYCGAEPVFVDVDRDTMGLSPDSLRDFFEKETFAKNSQCFNTHTRRRISAVLPMHTFGLPGRIDEIVEVCREYGVPIIEDAAESIGSWYKGIHTGAFGTLGVLSFNGNKTITTGGGGMIITNDKALAKKAKHLTTTAKKPHSYEYFHDETGFNYRMPNLNAAVGCAQMEQLEDKLASKRELADMYDEFFRDLSIDFVKEPENSKANYWLNAILLKDRKERDLFLEETNRQGVMTRPVWCLMNRLTMFKNCQCSSLENARWLEERVLNIPSGYR